MSEINLKVDEIILKSNGKEIYQILLQSPMHSGDTITIPTITVSNE